ncbi:MAG: phosphate signaling complex protein PhoU [Deltaproteobacteria bacterium]|jgi:phosphate transport system protein|nr:phosphate signaling complex protein PhoU [Deltaproteobacteria bacterium]
MTRTFDPVIRELRDMLLQMGSRSEAIIEKSFRALEKRDRKLADEVITDDLEIDRLDVEIDSAILQALALNAPVAGDLREVFGIKMIATDLERVGDLARNIAKSARRSAERTPLATPPTLEEMARSAIDQLRRALDAYARSDVEAARAVLDDDDRVDAQEDEIIVQELTEIANDSEVAPQAVDLILVAKNLERVADHATNIAEDVILIAEARNIKHASKLGAVS